MTEALCCVATSVQQSLLALCGTSLKSRAHRQCREKTGHSRDWPLITELHHFGVWSRSQRSGNKRVGMAILGVNPRRHQVTNSGTTSIQAGLQSTV